MTLMTCPLHGQRNMSEFICGREVKETPDPLTCSDAAWSAHLILTDNAANEVCEWWMHSPSSYWFIARRNTFTGEIIQTYSVEEFFGTEADSGGDRVAA